jgi:hypothetical protein
LVEHKGGWLKIEDKQIGRFVFLFGFHRLPRLLPLVLVLDSFLFELFVPHSQLKDGGTSFLVDREILRKGLVELGTLFALDALARMLVDCGFLLGLDLWFLKQRLAGRCRADLVLI